MPNPFCSIKTTSWSEDFGLQTAAGVTKKITDTAYLDWNLPHLEDFVGISDKIEETSLDPRGSYWITDQTGNITCFDLVTKTQQAVTQQGRHRLVLIKVESVKISNEKLATA